MSYRGRPARQAGTRPNKNAVNQRGRACSRERRYWAERFKRWGIGTRHQNQKVSAGPESRSKQLQRMSRLFFRWPKHAIDRLDQTLPTIRVFKKLFTSSCRQPVVPGLAVVFRSSPKRCDPASILQAMQCRIKRTVLHLKNIFRALLDDMGNRMAMRRTQHQRLQNQ